MRTVAPLIEPETSPAPDPDLEATQRTPLVVILGPTASGKTALGIAAARRFDGEIVSADSRQIYRFMDIGTAKPTATERAAAPHHLIDIVTPDETCSLAQYQQAAYASIHAILARDRLPLLVGGTGQYITAVVEGWSIPAVPPNPARRRDLEDYAARHGPRALHDWLRTIDPTAAQRIDYRNVRRVVRALEVYLETGTPITVLQQKHPPPYNILTIGLTMPRDQLYARIDARVDHMLALGLEAEVRALLEKGYTWECPAMSGLGYAQWRPYFAGQASRDEVAAAIKRQTRALARRQYTWFKGRDAGIRWLDLTEHAPETALAWIANWLSNEGV